MAQMLHARRSVGSQYLYAPQGVWQTDENQMQYNSGMYGGGSQTVVGGGSLTVVGGGMQCDQR